MSPHPPPYLSEASSLTEIYRAKAVEQPEFRVFTFLDDDGAESGHLTYAELDRRARAIAAVLQEKASVGDRVALLYPPELEYLAGFIGSLYAGTVAVPAYPPDPSRIERTLPRLLAILKDSGARVVLTTSFVLELARSLQEMAPELGAVEWVATDSLPEGTEQAWKAPGISRESLAFLQYTSGSTGTPKGVMLSHGNLLHHIEVIARAFDIRPGSVGVSWLPPYHDMGLIGNILTPSAIIDVPSALMSPLTFLRQPRRWLEAITRYRGTHSGGPNFAFDLCVRKVGPEAREGLDLSSWRAAFCGAEPIRAETMRRFCEAFAPHGFKRNYLLPCYGMAEATLLVAGGPVEHGATYHDVDEAALGRRQIVASVPEAPGARTLVGSGQEVEGMEMVIVDPETRERTPPGRIGEIWIRSPSVARGYWGKPELTGLTFNARIASTGEGPFLRSGDLGCMHQGQLLVAGRIKDIFITRGRNLYPQDIESTVDRSHPAVRAGCVAAFSVESGGEERLGIAVEVDQRRAGDLGEVVAAVRDQVVREHDVSPHAIALITPGSIHKTTSGKIQRSACREAFLAGRLDLIHLWQAASEAPPPPRPAPAAPPAQVAPPAPTAPSRSEEELRAWLTQALASAVRVNAEAIDLRTPFAQYGLDSATGVGLVGDLERWLGRRLSATLVWDYPTIEALARHLSGGSTAPAGPAPSMEQAAPEQAAPAAAARPAQASQPAAAEPIAVVGIGCRFPGSQGPAAFWRLLTQGVDAITQVPPERWDLAEYYDPDPSRPGKMTTRWGGFLERIDGFDREFFGISPREAARMDPQQRLLLEVAWEALEDAGVPPERLAGTKTGVFIGISGSDYGALQLTAAGLSDAYAGTGSAMSIAANRLSYLLDVRGPSLAVDTACSSSLVALHLACRSLRQGESALALVGGVNVLLAPQLTVNFSKAGFMAPDGRCKPFDASANGYVRSEGAGVVVLKPLARARADGDTIYAVIRGTAVNQDGRSNGLTAPNRLAQEVVLREACRDAGVRPGQLQYVEAHGTGTALGDPIEAQALGAVLAEGRPAGSRCALGSVKSNIGHLEAAAGMAGLIKVALSLHHGTLVPSLHFREPNPHIPFSELPLRVQHTLEPWPATEGPRLAGVSSFGFGGTNAHAVLESADEPAPRQRSGESPRPLLLPLSARTPEALAALAGRYAEWFSQEPQHAQAHLEQLCYTASARRTHHPHRAAFTLGSAADLAPLAQALQRGEPRAGLSTGHVTGRGRPRVAFVFSGQGPQWWGMAQELLASQPVFRQVVERCDALLRPLAGWSLLDELQADQARSRLGETEVAQPALLALHMGLVALWRSHGLEPEAVLGHSVGELAAACTAGALSLQQAVHLVYHRARLMQRATGQGRMALVELPPSEVAPLLPGREGQLSLAAHNNPRACVVAGDTAALEQVLAELARRQVSTRLLPVNYAFHSPQLEPLQAELAEALADLRPSSTTLLMISTATGRQVEGTELDAAYWSRQIRVPVLFSQAVGQLAAQGYELFVEVGPHPVLSVDLQQNLQAQGRTATVLPSLRRNEPARTVLLSSLGALYTRGLEVWWNTLFAPESRRGLPLPSYPWQHERCWVDLSTPVTSHTSEVSALSRLLGRRFLSATSHSAHWELTLRAESLGALGDHRVQGVWTMPGTGYVEMALAAAAEHSGSEPRLLREVTFHRPLLLLPGEERTVQVSLTRGGAALALQIHSRRAAKGQEEDWTLHASGRLETGASEPAPVPLAELRQRCAQPVETGDYYRRLAGLGLEYGPSFQGLGQLWRGEGEALGRLELPAAVAQELGAYRFHPAVLDAALQVLGAAIPAEVASGAGLVLPAQVDRLQVLGAPRAPLWSHARLRPAQGSAATLVGDLLVLDAEGQVVARLEGLRLQRLDHASSEPVADWLYEVRWQPVETPPAPQGAPPVHWLLLGDGRGVGAALATDLRSRGDKATLVGGDEPLEPLLAGAPGGEQRVVYLRGLEGEVQEEAGAQSLQEALALGTSRVASLVRQLVGSSRRLWLVTRGAQPVEGPVSPRSVPQAALWGLGRTLAWEQPELWGGLVDLDPSASAEQCAGWLAELLSTAGSEDQLAVRGGKRYAARMVRRRDLAARPALPALRADATYLITGGLGGVGARVARWLVEQGARRLILMGRTRLPPRSTWQRLAPGEALAGAVRTLRQLEALGASVHVASVDVGDEAALARYLEEFQQEGWPEIRGVVHAAGVLDERDTPLTQLESPTAEVVLRPKAVGGWLLHRLLQSAPLDFFVLFSSASALLGAPRQAAYAAANAVLDALAHARHAVRLPALSLDWGAWGEVGMAAGGGRGNALALLGVRPMAPERALEALGLLLGSPAASVGALSVDWSTLRPLVQGQARPWLSALLAEPAPSSRSIAASNPVAELLAMDEASRRQALLALIQGEVASALGLEPSRVDTQEPLTHFGFDSIMALELRNRLQARLPISVPLVLLVQGPSLAQLVDRLLPLLPAAASPAPQAPERAQGPELRNRGPEEGLPLSFGQERMWFLTQLTPDTYAYNLGGALRLEGTLDVAVLERAFTELVRRHEVLRSAFPAVEGRPTQVILPPAPVSIATLDLSALPPEQREAEARRLGEEEPRRPFELARGPLLRVVLLRLAPKEHVLVLGMHHIISDAWSMMAVLVQEVVALYAAFVAGQPSPLPELPVQYADYAVWERKRLRAEVLTPQLEYWRKQLAGAPGALELPTDRPRPAVQTYRGARHELELPRELTERVKQLASREGATLFMTALAALDVLLSRWSGQQDISVGAAVTNRARRELEGLIGLFTNTVVLRTDLSGEPSFRQLLGRVREMTLAAYAHQEVPFERLVDELQPVRSLSRSPFFQVVLLMQNNPMPEVALPGLRLKGMEGDSGTGQVELTLELWDRPEGVRGWFIYNTDLFDASTIERMGAQYRTLLESIVARPDVPVSALGLLPEPERRRLLLEWNASAREFPSETTAHQLFEARAARHPEALAAGAGDERLTYGELNRRANRMARVLVEQGVVTDQVVPLLSERGLELLTAMLATSKAGGAYLPLDPLYPAQRLGQMLEQSSAPLAIVSRSLEPLVSRALERLEQGRRPRVLLLEECLAASRPEDNLPPRTTPRGMAYVIYTSGSTGVPKGVMVEHRGMVNHLYAKNRDLGLTEADVIGQTASQNFDIFVYQNVTALLEGGRTQIVSTEDMLSPPRLLEQVRRHGITVLNIVPSQLRLLVEEVARNPALRESLASLRWMMPTGEALPPELVRQWMELFPSLPVLNAYGHTECSDDQAHHPMREPPQGSTTPIGRPIQNLRFYALDRHLSPLPTGVTGELYIGGVGVGRGYLGDPAKTAEKFLPDPFSSEPGSRLYRTGDLGRWRPDGKLEMMGRVDFMVKLRGFRVELGEVESALLKHPGVREAVAHVPPGAQRLVAYVVPRPEQATTVAELRAFLKQALPEHMVPSAFLLLEALPLTPNGKVDRKALPAPEGSRSAEDGYVAPRTPVEQVLAELWAGVLGLERVGVHDSFFDLGGHSLLATQAMARVREALRVDLPLRDFFESPTVGGLAAKIEQAAGSHRALPPLAPAPRQGSLPLSFAQQRLWFLDQLEPQSSFYNIPAALRLEGQLDVAALQRSFEEVLWRHEAIRTTFRNEEGHAVQVIWPASSLPLAAVDLSGLPAEEREREVRRLSRQEARRPFDLVHGPLLRVSLLRLGGQLHVLLVTMHHIISDGWSMGVLVRELAALYGAFVAGQPSPLPPLPVQYVDYALWQRSWLRGEVLQEQLSWWRKQLEGAPHALELPTDRPRPAVQTFNGAHCGHLLPGSLVHGLRELARRQGVTPFMVLLAASQALLGRYAGQEDVCVGTPVAGRTRLELESLIGLFVNPLVMRTRLSGNPTFSELLGRVREVTLGAYAHQDLPFERLVEELQPQRDSSRSPLFQVLCVVQDDLLPELRVPGLSLRMLEVESHTSKLDMLLTFTTTAEGMVAALEYNTDLFDGGTAERLLGHLHTLLEAAVGQPEQRLYSLPLLPQAERQRLLVEWNETRRAWPGPLCVHELFEQQVERAPEATAVVFGEQRLTFRELEEGANRVAHLLRSLGVGPEVLVGLCLERSLELVVGLLGVLKAGGAYLPVDPSYPRERVAFMLEDARAPVLLTQQRLLPSLPEGQARRVCLDAEAELLARQSPARVASGAGGANLAYVIYTSGSTGRPKGVMIEHAGVSNYLRWCTEAYAMAEGTGAPVHSSVAFDLTVTSLLAPLMVGRPAVLVPQGEDVEGLSAVLRAGSNFSVVKLTPTHLQMLSHQLSAAEARGRTRAFIVGGEALPAESLALWREQAPETRLINEYGPTETVVGCCIHEVAPEDPATGSVPIGRPIANTQLYVLDRSLEPVPVGVHGELYIGGGGVGRGYLGRPELTAERFVPDPFSTQPGARLYRTGDRARWLADGRLDFLGRLDHQVKVRGYRIELGEIDSVLAQHPGVREVLTVVREDTPGNPRLVAYLAPRGTPAPAESELRQYLGSRLPEYMVPSALVLLGSLPLTSNGKVDRSALPAPEAPRAAQRSSVFSGPRDALEAQLIRIWEDLLGVHPITPQSDFFALGGHSLLAVRLMARIAKVTGRKLPVSALLPTATLESLARKLRQDARPWSPLVELTRADKRRPFFCVHPVGGNVICYTELSHLLGPEQPFYGLQSRGMEGEAPPLTSIAEMAGLYLQAVRSVQPHGPYLLGGWSMGGNVAFEMAQQLQRQGEQVELLVMIETSAVADLERPPPEQLEFFMTVHFARMVAQFFQVDLHIPEEELARMSPQDLLDHMLEEGRRTNVLLPEAGVEQIRALRQVFERNLEALWSYRPQPYSGPLVLLRGDEGRPYSVYEQQDFGWGAVAQAGLEVHVLTGNHESIIRSPHVEALADRLKEYLERAHASGTGKVTA